MSAVSSPEGAIDGRLFVVGCSRSGTTLLQSFLAAHPSILAFPESAVFARLLSASDVRVVGAQPPPDQIREIDQAEERRLQVAARLQAAHRRATALLDSLDRSDLKARVPGSLSSIEQFGIGFVALIDQIAMDRGKRWWMEKAPGNLKIVPEIRRLAPRARFISILRDGRQNVASLYEMALRFPDAWWATYRNLDTAIERWNICVRCTRALLDDPDVLVIRYERLLSATEATLQEVCTFMGLKFSREMIDRRADAASSLILTAEPWKADVLRPVRPVAENKFDKLFDAQQKAYITSRLEPIDF